MKVSQFYPTTIFVDDPSNPDTLEEIKIRVKRFTVDEYAVFVRDFRQCANRPSNARLARKPNGDEQEKRDVLDAAGKVIAQEFVISDDDVKMRRLSEMDETDRSEYDDMDREEEAFAMKFTVDMISKYVSVEPDQIFEDQADGSTKTVTTGADMLRIFGGREDIVRQMLSAVRQENTLSSPAKKILRSLSASARFSDARRLAAVGQKPELTADAAASAASVQTEDVIAPATIPSGSADQS